MTIVVILVGILSLFAIGITLRAVSDSIAQAGARERRRIGAAYIRSLGQETEMDRGDQ